MARTGPATAIQDFCWTRCNHTAEREGLHGSSWWTRGYCARICEHSDCPLYPYRMGRNPARAGIGGRPRSRAVNRNQQSNGTVAS